MQTKNNKSRFWRCHQREYFCLWKFALTILNAALVAGLHFVLFLQCMEIDGGFCSRTQLTPYMSQPFCRNHFEAWLLTIAVVEEDALPWSEKGYEMGRLKRAMLQSAMKNHSHVPKYVSFLRLLSASWRDPVQGRRRCYADDGFWSSLSTVICSCGKTIMQFQNWTAILKLLFLGWDHVALTWLKEQLVPYIMLEILFSMHWGDVRIKYTICDSLSRN